MPSDAVRKRSKASGDTTVEVRDPASLKAHLQKAGLTFASAGEAAGTSASAISHLTSGRRTRTYTTVAAALASACGVPLEDLFASPVQRLQPRNHAAIGVAIKASGKSRAEVSRAAGISGESLAALIHGNMRSIGAGAAAAIAQACGCTVEHLFEVPSAD